MKKTAGIFLTTTFLGLATHAGAAILITDDFNNLASGANLQTRTPDGVNFVNNINGNGWSTNTSLMTGNGSGGLNALDSATRNALIDLGSSNYFTTNPGVYTLSATLRTPAGNAGTSWVGIGFSTGNTLDQSFNGLGGGPFVFQRNNGVVAAFAGPDAVNGSTAASVTTGVAHTFVVTLNTVATRWTVDVTVDGVALDLDGGGAGTAFTYGPGLNPVTTRYLGIAMAFNNDATATQTLDNFSFQGPLPVPEPGALAMAAAAAGMAVMRRRRRA